MPTGEVEFDNDLIDQLKRQLAAANARAEQAELGAGQLDRYRRAAYEE